MTNKITTDSSPQLGEFASRLTTLTGDATIAAIEALRTRNKAEDIYLAACGVAGAMHVLASLVAKQGDKVMWERVDDNTTLFASILTAKLCPRLTKTEDGNIRCDSEFGPHVIAAALEAMEKLLGHRPDEYLDQHMVTQTREYLADPEAQEELMRLKAENDAKLAAEAEGKLVKFPKKPLSKHLN